MADLFSVDFESPAPELGPVAGVDEVGRGPLAGDVVAAAVILDPAAPIDGLRDSKKLTESRREVLAEAIRERALAWSVARASVAEIDEINILQASLLAMHRAVAGLEQTYPGYGFATHKGYPTRDHLAALRELGVTPVHRKSFAPVKNLLDGVASE